MSGKPFDCATCGKDMLFELPQSLYRWNSPTDERVFCSGNCITQSKAAPDTKTYTPAAEYDL